LSDFPQPPLYSHTSEPNKPALTEDYTGYRFSEDKYTVDFDGESYGGFAFISRFRRSARNWSFRLDYNQIEPTYRTQTGYDPVNNHRTVTFWTNYQFFLESSIFDRINPSIYTNKRWDFTTGEKRREVANLSLYTRLKYAMTDISVSYARASEMWEGINFKDIWSADMYISSQLTNQIGYGLYMSYGKILSKYDVALGNETVISAGLNLKPIDRLIIEPNLDYARSIDVETDEELYDGYIFRTRIRYQATKALSFRFIIQYNDFSESWDFDPLMTYRINPFTVLYFGSTYDYQNFTSDKDNIRRWELSSRNVFMKLQYLFSI